MEAIRKMKTKAEQVDEWMATKPVIRDIINGVLVETTGEDRRVRFEQSAAEMQAMESIAAPVPSRITAWQAKAALSLTPHPQAGTMLEAAEAALNAMPDGVQKVVVMSAWGNNANFERISPTILSFGAALGMSSDDLDNLFRLGESLSV